MREDQQPTFRDASDQSVLVTFSTWSPLIHQCDDLLRIPGIRNLHPAYDSLLVVFDSLVLNRDEVESSVRSVLKTQSAAAHPEPQIIDIPVTYGGESGPDLEDVAALCSLTPDQVIEAHAGTIYKVYFIGFVPGFAYLGELPPEIAAPRLRSPRKNVPAGSVAIGGKQTGVYPMSTPGGWRLIGRTNLTLFDPRREKMSLLQAGDRVRFVPV